MLLRRYVAPGGSLILAHRQRGARDISANLTKQSIAHDLIPLTASVDLSASTDDELAHFLSMLTGLDLQPTLSPLFRPLVTVPVDISTGTKPLLD